MKKAGFVIVSAFVLLAPSLGFAQKTFEGTITWSLTLPQMGDDAAHPMTMNVKDQQVEAEIDMGTMGLMKTYTDNKTRKGYVVMEAMKMGYTMDLPSDSSKDATKSEMPDIKPTGHKMTVAGHAAEEYLLKGVHAKTGTADLSIWVTSDFPKEIQIAMKNGLKNSAQDPKEAQVMKYFANKGLVPVRIVTMSDGDTAATMEFVKFEAKHLDDALFVPPTDIKFQPMPTAPGGGMN